MIAVLGGRLGPSRVQSYQGRRRQAKLLRQQLVAGRQVSICEILKVLAGHVRRRFFNRISLSILARGGHRLLCKQLCHQFDLIVKVI